MLRLTNLTGQDITLPLGLNVEWVPAEITEGEAPYNEAHDPNILTAHESTEINPDDFEQSEELVSILLAVPNLLVEQQVTTQDEEGNSVTSWEHVQQ